MAPKSTVAVAKRSCSTGSAPSFARGGERVTLHRDVEVRMLGAEQQVADGAADEIRRLALELRAQLGDARQAPEALGDQRGVDALAVGLHAGGAKPLAYHDRLS